MSPDDHEELFFDDDMNMPDPLGSFHGFYIITKEDGSEPEKFDVTIKGELPEVGHNIGHYTVVYSDGTTKTIDWQPGGVGWVEREGGKTPHALSIGALIEKHFGPDND